MKLLKLDLLMQKLYILGSNTKIEQANVIYWNDKIRNSSHTFDIFSIIDKHKYEVRKKYLAWIYKLQNIKIGKKNLKEYISLNNTFSIWWMHPIVEKSNLIKSYQINNVLKLIALEEFLKKKNISQIITVGLNSDTNKIISNISKSKKILFFKRHEKIKYSFNFAVLNFFKSITWLIIYVIKRRSLFGLNLLKWKNSKNKICIVNYLFDIDYTLLKKKRFLSGYWGNLIQKIKTKKIGINWLNIYFEHEKIPNSKSAKKIIKDLGKINSRDIHVSLETFLNFKIIFKSLKMWIKIFFKSLMIKNSSILNNKYENILFKILEVEFFNNLQNHHSLKNILVYFLMNEAFNIISKQNTCIFPNENQPWEMALMNVYKYNFHRNIIGYQHSTTRFWDLRTFYHHKEYSNKLKHSYPKPHQLAVHSKIFFSILLKANYPKNNLRLVETLKYNKLIKNQKTLKKKVYPKFNKNKINITLILASLKNFDQALINCLKKNLKNFDNNYSFYLKDQLSSDAVLKIEETKMFKKVYGNLQEIYKNSDLVIISNPSSAVLDAMFTGTPFFVYDGGNFINFSPMYSVIKDKYFIRDYEFVSKIKTFKNKSLNTWKFDKKKILESNDNIYKWQKIINLNRLKNF